MSVNKVILVGNVGKDPEVRYLDSGVCVASFPLATSERGFTTRDGVQVPERTEWHNVVLWRGQAEVAEKYVKKGSQLFIEGKIRTRSWEDEQGVRKYFVEIHADSMQLLGKRPEGEVVENHAGDMSEKTNGQSAEPSVMEQPATGSDKEGDDLPF